MCTYTYIHTNIIQSREEQDTVSGLRPIMVIVSLPLGPAAPASEIDRRVPQGRHNLILHHQYAFNTCLHIGIYDVYTLGMHTCLHTGAAPLSACTRLPHPCVLQYICLHTGATPLCTARASHHIARPSHHYLVLSYQRLHPQVPICSTTGVSETVGSEK